MHPFFFANLGHSILEHYDDTDVMSSAMSVERMKS